MEVAQPAVRLFQVGLEQKGDVTVGAVTLLDLGGEDRKPLAGAPPPLRPGFGQHGIGDRCVAGYHPAVEEAELGPEIVAGHLEDFRRPAHRVVELDPLVPHRVPDGVGDLGDVAPAGVDEHHVEVAERRQLAPSVPTHGDQRQALGRALGRPGEQPGQPPVGGRRIGGTEGLTLEVGLRQQLLAQGAQRHGRR